MLDTGNIIDIDESRKPFNSYMRLSLALLQIILPVIQAELLNGLIDNDKNDNVILHLNLGEEKIKLVRQISQSFEKHHNVLIK
jgi:hypothetical protein